MFNIALNTFRELVRSRIFALIVVFSAVLIVFSLLLANLSLGQSERIVLDFGLSMIEISGLIAVVFVGGQMLLKETEGRTIYLILSKPIKRYAFLLGKFLGFSAILGIIVAFESTVLTGLLFMNHTTLSWLYGIAIVSIYVKLLTIFAITLFFSTFSSAILSVLFSIGIYIASHSVYGVLDMALHTKNEIMTILAQGLTVLLPNFEALSYPKTIFGGILEVPYSVFTISLAHGLGYMVVILLLAVVTFSYKNFENA